MTSLPNTHIVLLTSDHLLGALSIVYYLVLDQSFSAHKFVLIYMVIKYPILNNIRNLAVQSTFQLS